MINFVTYWWGQKYGPEHVAKLLRAIDRNVTVPHRIYVINSMDTPLRDVQAGDIAFRAPLIHPDDEYLTRVQGCFARLRLFDPLYQQMLDIEPGERIVSLDLDNVIVANLDDLLRMEATFRILQNVNLGNPCPYNGSLWMLEAGKHANVWHDFSLEAVARVPYYQFPDDQAWLHFKIPNAAEWLVDHGVYGFQKRGWASGDNLPLDAKLVAFFGRRDPSQYTHLKWVREHWK